MKSPLQLSRKALSLVLAVSLLGTSVLTVNAYQWLSANLFDNVPAPVTEQSFEPSRSESSQKLASETEKVEPAGSGIESEKMSDSMAQVGSGELAAAKTDDEIMTDEGVPGTGMTVPEQRAFQVAGQRKEADKTSFYAANSFFESGSVKSESDFSASANVFALDAEPGEATAAIETNTITTDENWQTVTLEHQFQNPVIVASFLEQNNTLPASVRVRNVGSGSFEVRLQHPADADLQAEEITFVVVEEGTWEIGGVKIEAHTYNTATVGSKTKWQYDSQSFSHTYAESPIVLHQVMSSLDESWISSFVSDLNTFTNPPGTDGIRIGLNGAEATSSHGAETIGWIAIERNRSFVVDDKQFETYRTTDTVLGHDDECATFGFQNRYSDVPLVIVAQQEMDGNNGGWAVACDRGDSYIGIHTEEDQEKDSERVHTTETMGFLAIGTSAGPLFPVVSNEAENLAFELDSVTTDENWQTVSLKNTYVKPVIVASLQEQNNTLPASIRIRNAGSNGFEIRLQHPANADLQPEKITYLVMEEGVWEIDGMKIEAHTYVTSTVGASGGWRYDTQSFGHTYTDSPIVLHQVMSSLDESWISSFVSDLKKFTNPPGTDGIRIGLNGAEVTKVHGTEMIGWIAFEKNQPFTIGQNVFETYRTTDSVMGHDDGSGCFRFGYQNIYSETPLVIAAQQEMDGNNGGWAVVCSNDGTQIGLHTEEDQEKDSERRHTTETMAFLASAGPVVYPGQNTDDTEAPIVNITSPLNGVTAEGIIEIVVDASDNTEVAAVSIQIDGQDTGDTKTATPFVFDWDSTTVSNGEYALTATASDAMGNTTISSPITITVANTEPDTEAPTAPQNLSATVIDQQQIDLVWEAATDNSDSIGYKLFRDGIEIANVITTSYQDTGLIGGTEYTYQVSAVDEAGNEGSLSNTVSATTSIDSTDPGPTTGGAPERAIPYAEDICNNDPDVFFCEDFEGEDLSLDGTVGDSPNKYWNNPALENTDIYWAVGGSHQRSTITLPGFDQESNHVYRISKDEDFTDIVTGLNPGTGSGTISGFLDPEIMGSGAREWYTRVQVYFHETHQWPASLDYKVFFALPREFVDPPSAEYETGIYFHEDYACQVDGSWTSVGGDVPIVRYSSNFRGYPELGENCPTLEPGEPANGVNAPRVEKGRWYTLEYHVKLAEDDSGILELWVDGNKAYEYTGITCHNGCADMGYIMIMGWMNAADSQSGYAEYDNIVMSRSYIGPPDGFSSQPPSTGTDTTPPSTPASVTSGEVTETSVTLNWTAASDDTEVAGYRVYRDAVLVGEVNGLSYTDTTVVAGTDYEYMISAIDGSGNESGGSEAISITTSGSSTETPVARGSFDGLVLGMSFEEGNGSLAGDVSGLGNNGTVDGATWSPEGRYEGALAFDGVDDWVTVADSNSLDLTTGMTLSAWVKPTGALATWPTTLLKEQSGDLVYSLYANSDRGAPSSYVYSNTQLGAHGSEELTQNEWTYLTSTYDGSNLKYFVNGIEVDSIAASGDLVVSDGALRIGGNGVWSNEFFTGLIDEVRVYNRALSASEIGVDMERGVGIPAPAVEDTEAPSVPMGLSATAVSGSRIDISWEASTDDVGVSQYGIFRNGEEVAVVSSAGYTDSGLSPETNYEYTVVARDAAGNESGLSSAASATTLAAGAAVDPTQLPLVQQSDISYLGSFSVPNQDNAGNPLSYGGYALGYNPTNNSLFFGCHDWYDLVAEVSIPGIGGLATVLQPCTDIYEGNPIDDDYNGLHPAGNLVYNDRLISTEIAWYDADGTQQTSHGVSSSLDLSDTNNFDGWYGFTGVDAPARALAGYMTLIPEEWRELFGGPAMTGQAAVSIIGSSSDGPAATVFDPDEVGNSPELQGTTVVFHPISNSHPDFEAKGSQIAGMAFPDGSRSVLFFGSRAQHPYCYGTNEECPYSCFMHKGPHNEYKHAIWAYDANELLKVKNGELEPWEVQPYATFELDDITSGNCASVRFGGATFDQENGILYVVEAYGDNPAVHAFQIGDVSGSTPPPPADDTTPPSVPANVGTSAVTETSVTLSWSAATDDTAVSGYRAYRDGVLVGEVNGLSYVDSGLVAGTDYEYTISAIDGSGNESGTSEVVSMTTQESQTVGSGNVLYVDATSGDDTVSYTQNSAETPWRTLGRAAWGSTDRNNPVTNEAAQAGDTVIVREGVYTAPGTGERYAPAFNPVNSGTPGEPITFRAEGLVELRHSSGTGPIAGTYERSYIVWDGFYINEAHVNTIPDTGPVVVWYSDHITIQNMHLQGIHATWLDNHNAIRTERSDHVLIRNNDIHDFRMSQGGSNGSAIMTYYTNYLTIEHNEIYDSDGGIFIKGGDEQHGVIIRNNYIHDIASTHLRFGGVGLNTPDYGARVHNNILANGDHIPIMFTPYAPGIPASVHIYNNTISNIQWVIYGATESMESLTLHNNIFSGYNSGMLLTYEDTTLSPFSFEHNVYFGSGRFAEVNGVRYNDLDSNWYNAFGFDQASPASVAADPLFVNVAEGDYHLQSNSPARTLGVDTLDLDNDGSTTDIIPAGAYVTGEETIGLLDAGEPVPPSDPDPQPGDDTTPPSVSLVSPAEGGIVSGTLTVIAEASDDVQIRDVRFEINGISVGSEDTVTPYETDWNTTTVTDGTHTVTAIATDTSGNQSTVNVTVTVENGTGGETGGLACDQVGQNEFFGCYYDGIAFNELVATQADPAVEFDWGSGSPSFLTESETFSVVWQGDFELNGGEYLFSATTDDGIRVYVDGILVIDEWRDQGATTFTELLTLAAGTHRIGVEYFEAWGDAVARLEWNLVEPSSGGDTTPPSVPANVGTGEVAETSVTLNWSAATDDTAVAGYRVYRDGVQVAEIAETSYTDTELTAGTSYEYTISAIDGSGNESGASESMNVTTTSDSTTPIPEGGLINWNDFAYQGAFKVPEGNWQDTSESFAYAGRGIAYFPDGDGGNGSLFLTGHSHYDNVGEIGIPDTVASADIESLPTAEVLQLPREISGGAKNAVDDPLVHGLLYTGGKLLVNYFRWYSVDGNSSWPSHGTISPDLDSSTFRGLWSMNDENGTRIGNNFVAGYMSTIPTSWQAAFGFPLMTGKTNAGGEGNINGSSHGPSFYGFDPLLADGSIPDAGDFVSARQFLHYPTDDRRFSFILNGTQYSWAGANSLRGAQFLELPDGRSAIVYFATVGLGEDWYGEGTQYPGTSCSNNKGFHAGPYKSVAIFYDPNELLRVANGEIEPWEAVPYEVMDLSQYTFGDDCQEIGGTSFDETGQKLYMIEKAGANGGSVIHVFDVISGTTTEPDTTPPSTPTTVNQDQVNDTSVTLSWSAATDDTAVSGYRVYRNGSQVAEVTETSYTDTELTAETSYEYTISAIDGSGNESGGSEVVNVTTNTSAGGSGMARLQPSDLSYQGAFLLPTDDFFAAMGELGYPQTSGMTFNPDGNNGNGSLFIIGRGGRVAEVDTPPAKTVDLATATVLQSNINPFSYGASGENDATAGIAYMTPKGSQTTPKLYFGSFEYYNVDGTDYNSLGWAETNLSNPQSAGLWHVGPPANGDLDTWSHGMKSGEYLIPISQSWADQYTDGRSLLVGRTREAAGAGGSAGPVLLATAPWENGSTPAAGTAIPATPLMYYSTNVVLPQGNSTDWQNWRMENDPDWAYWSPVDRTNGGAWIEKDGKRALVLGIRHGTFDNDPVQPKYGSDGSHGGFVDDPSGQTPPFCYGDASQCSGEVSTGGNKGYHAGPIRPRLAFIGIDELETVATGSKDPSSITAYNVYDLMNDFGAPEGTQLDRTGSNDIVGIAYDEGAGKLYVGQSNGNDPNGHPNAAWPVIHVYQVGFKSDNEVTPTLNLTATPVSVIAGETSTITWNSTDADTCTASGDWGGTKAVSGSEVMSPATNETYTLTCQGAGGSVNKTVDVTVENGGGDSGGSGGSGSVAGGSFDGLVLGLSFDEGTGTVASDASGLGNDGVVEGAVWVGEGEGRFGGALAFDGASDWVTVLDADSLDLTTGMTLSAWVKPSGGLVTWPTVIMKEYVGHMAYSLYGNSGSGNVSSYLFAGAETGVEGGGSLAVDQWTYLTATYDGQELRVFVNGVEGGSIAMTDDIVISDGVLRVGGNSVWGNEYFSGSIDEVRVYDRALSASEIGVDMERSVVESGGSGGGSVDPSLVGEWKFEGDFNDGTGNGYDGVESGGVTFGEGVGDSDGIVGQGAVFDGVDDLVNLGGMDIGGGTGEELTIAAWFRADDFDHDDARIISKATGTAEQDHYWMLSTKNSGGMKLRFRLKTGGSTSTLVAAGGGFDVGEWVHGVAVYDGSMMRLYQNGVEVGSLAKSGVIDTNDSVEAWIGNSPGAIANPFDGVIDEVRVYERALSGEEIGVLFGGSVPPEVEVGVPVVSLGASPAVVATGGSTTLSWNATDADTCTASGDWSGEKGVSGSETVTPSVNMTYTISCTGSGGTASDSVTVTVSDTTSSDSVTVTNATELQDALTNATGGETILLASGNYGNITISNQHYNSYITLKSIDVKGAIFGKLTIDGSSYISIDSITATNGREGVYITNSSHHIELLNSEIIGGSQFDRSNPDYTQVSQLYGVQVSNSSDIRIENNYAHDIKSTGFYFNAVTGLTLRGNNADWTASDCYKFASVSNALIENNTGCREIHASPDAHKDFMQSQGDMSDVVFRGNVALMKTSSFQGIFLADADYSNILIEDNIIYTGHIRGISVANATNVTARNNTVLNALNLVHKSSQIMGTTHSENNVVGTYLYNAGADGTNHQLQYEDQNSDYFYNSYYKNPMHGPGLTIEDLEPVAGSPADGQVGAYKRIRELLSQSNGFTVTNATELQDALTNATGGETILLASGSYGGLDIVDRNFNTEVTIQSADRNNPAIFTGIRLTDSGRLVFDGIEIVRPAGSTCLASGAVPNLFVMENPSHVSILNSKITSERTYDAGRAIIIENGDHVTVDNTEITNVGRSGIRFYGTNINITNNHLHHISESPIGMQSGSSANHVLIEGNHVHDQQKYTSEPCFYEGGWDGIHGSAVALREAQNVVIRDNVFHNMRLGWIQLYNGEFGKTYHFGNITVEGNIWYDNAGAYHMYNPGSDSVIDGPIIIRYNTVISGNQDENWLYANGDDPIKRFWVGSNKQTFNALSSPNGIVENNIFLTSASLPAEYAKNNLVYHPWTSGLDPSNKLIAPNIPGTYSADFIDTELFVNPLYTHTPHGNTCEFGGPCDFTPQAGSIICGMGTDGGHIGAIPCEEQPSTPEPTLAFTSSATPVASGDTVTLTWNTTDADTCTASGDWSGEKGVSGSEVVDNITEVMSFTLTCEGSGGSASETMSVTIASDPVLAAYPTSSDEVGITDEACPNFPTQIIDSITLGTAGQVLENVQVNGRINVEAADVTINCVTANGGIYALKCLESDGCTGLTVTNSEFIGGDSSSIYLQGNTNANISKSVIGEAADGIKVNASGNTFERNYLTCTSTSNPSGHMDGVQSRSGYDNAYRFNNFSEESCPSSANQGLGSASFFIEEGPHDRLVVEGNYFSGGGYTVRLISSQIDNLTFINNVIERDSWGFGPLTWGPPQSSCAHWEGNAYHDGVIWQNTAADDAACDLPVQIPEISDPVETVHVSDTAELQNAIAGATGGQIIVLVSGNYGELTISDQNMDSEVSIVAAPDATPVFTGISVNGSSNWRLSGLHVKPRYSSGADGKTAVNISGNSITFENSEIDYADDISGWSASDWLAKTGNGIGLSGTDNIVRNNIIKNVDHGMNSGATNSVVSGNTIMNFRGDGIRGLGDDMVYEYNIIKNSYDVDDNHDDGFQSWTSGSGGVGTGVVRNVVLRGNTIIDFEDPNQAHQGAMQGIGLFDGFFENWTIENNLIVTNHWHGITLLGARDTVIINNTVLDADMASPGPPWIQIDNHKNGTASTGNVVRNNLATALNLGTDVTADHNIEFGMDELATYFVDPQNGDFRPAPSAPTIDSGSMTLAPTVDIEKKARPQNSGYDIGAYEFTDGTSPLPKACNDGIDNDSDGLTDYPNDPGCESADDTDETDVTAAQACSEISQYGVTWTFDQEYPCGQFINGDWWVQGPAVVTSISPDFDGSMHGWQVDPAAGTGVQGFDSRIRSFDENLIPALPYTVNAGESILKAVSDQTGDCYGRGHTGHPCYLYTTSVLTVLADIPPDNGATVFRPSFMGDVEKKMYSTQSLRTELLPSLPAVANAPTLEEVENNFKRVQLDYTGSWTGRYLHPSQNMWQYGSNIGIRTNEGALRLMLDDPLTEKMPALIAYLQAGIDFYSMMKAGADWHADGGHFVGRKLPMVFAATLLDDAQMKQDIAAASSNIFSEDDHTYYGQNGVALFGKPSSEQQYWQRITQNQGSRDNRDPYGYVDGGGTEIGGAYQTCCTGNSYKGSALAALLLPGGRETWDYEAFFDYVDRFITFGVWANPDSCSLQDPVNYTGQCVSGNGRFTEKHGVKPNLGYGSAFVNSMWDQYYEQTQTPDTTPPSSPTGLVAAVRSAVAVELSWAAASDDVGVTGYKVYRDGVEVEEITASSFTDTGLTASTGYEYTVTAVDGAGNESGVSEAVSVVTDEPDEMAPTGSVVDEGLVGATVTGGVLVEVAAWDNIEVAGVQLAIDGVEVGEEDTEAPYEVLWNTYGVANGTHVLSAVVRDSSGNETRTEGVEVVVENTVTVGAGLVGYWQFEGDFNDGTGNGYDGVESGGVTFGEGVSVGGVGGGGSGEGAVFDGVDDLVNLGGMDIGGGTGEELTIAAWFRADDFDHDDARIISKATGTAEQDHYWMLSTKNSGGMKLRFRLKTGGSTSTLVAVGGGFDVGEWVHGVAVYDGSMMRLYQNGVEVGSLAKSGVIDTNDSVEAWIGNSPGAIANPFDGVIDEVRVYERALSGEEIGVLFGGSVPPEAEVDFESPSVPLNVSAAAVSSSRVDVSWEASTDNTEVTGYVVFRCEGTGCDPTTPVMTVSGTSYSDNGLNAETVYGYAVAAVDASGNESGRSAVVAISTDFTTTSNSINVSTASELQAAINSANGSGGDVEIVLADGTYTLNDTLYVNVPGVTLRSASGVRENVIIEGDAMSGNATVGNVIRVAADDFVIRDLTLQKSRWHLIQIAGETDADNAVIRNVVFRDSFEQMLKITYDPNSGVSADGGLVEDSLFYYTAGVGPQWYIGGIDGHQVKNWTVRNNTFRDIISPGPSVAEHAVHFWSDAADNIVEGNTIINCDRGIGFGLGDRGNSGGVIRNNMIYHANGKGQYADVAIGLENSAGTEVYNNTIYLENDFPWAIEYRFSGTQNVQIRNNLTNRPIQQRDGGSATVSDNITDAQGSWFVDPAAGDLHLASESLPAVDAGAALAGLTEDIDGDSRPQGAGVEVGADEVSGGGGSGEGDGGLSSLPEGNNGIAAQYPGDASIQDDTDVVFSENFESYSSTSDLWNTWDNFYQQSNLTIDTDEYFEGSKSLRERMPNTNSEVSNAVVKLIDPTDEVYVRSYMRYAPNFDGVNSAHDGFSIRANYSGPGSKPNGTDFFLVNIENSQFRNEGPLGYTNAYVYHPEQNDDYGEHWYPSGYTSNGAGPDGGFGSDFVARTDTVPQRGEWFSREVYVKANTPGQRDGRVAVWENGVLIADWQNIRFRDVGTVKIDQIEFENGGQGSSQVNDKWYDNIVVAHSYIGPFTPGTTTPICGNNQVETGEQCDDGNTVSGDGCSNSCEVESSDTTAPSTPTNLTATVQSADSVNLSWTASKDQSGILKYQLERCLGAGCADFTQIAAPETVTYHDSGLNTDLWYRYRVKALDLFSNLSSSSNIVSVQTSDSDNENGNNGESQCNGFSQDDMVPLNFGSAYDLFSTTKQIILNIVSCAASPDSGIDAIIQAGNGRTDEYVYTQGYYSEDQQWRPFTYLCQNGDAPLNGKWCHRSAHVNLLDLDTKQSRYILAYHCRWGGDKWLCGCRNKACTERYWNVQKIAP